MADFVAEPGGCALYYYDAGAMGPAYMIAYTISRWYIVPCRVYGICIDNAPVLSCGIPTVVYIIVMMLYTRSFNVKS